MKKLLRRAHIRFTMYPKIAGNPDFLVCGNIVVFCDSSFWHGRHWRRLREQLRRGSNPSYWVTHIARNRRRDRAVNGILREMGYHVMRFWDDEVLKHPDRCLKKLMAVLRSIP
jgi:DNA mismatch endonuclease Vsr